jgi:carbonic anhydrase
MGSSLSKVLHHQTPASKTEQPSMLTQSPIDLTEDPAAQLVTLSTTETALQFGTAKAELQLTHGGDNFQVNWSDHEGNYLVLKGKKYYTVQFHFHAPSTINSHPPGQAYVLRTNLLL